MYVKELVKAIIQERNVQCVRVHHITDSPFSQYRNKLMFYLIANHKDIFGVEGCWNNFEAGHGKGPCDGVGGA